MLSAQQEIIRNAPVPTGVPPVTDRRFRASRKESKFIAVSNKDSISNSVSSRDSISVKGSIYHSSVASNPVPVNGKEPFSVSGKKI